MTGTVAVGYILSMLIAWISSQCRDPRLKPHRFSRKKSQSITSVMQIAKVSLDSKGANERDETLAYKEGRKYSGSCPAVTLVEHFACSLYFQM